MEGGLVQHVFIPHYRISLPARVGNCCLVPGRPFHLSLSRSDAPGGWLAFSYSLTLPAYETTAVGCTAAPCRRMTIDPSGWKDM